MAGAVELSFRGAGREAELGGDFVMLPTLHIVENKDRPSLRWKRGDRLFEIESYAWWRYNRWYFECGRIIGEEHPGGQAGAGAQLHEDSVDGETVQPGTKGAVATKERQFFPRSDEGLLGQFFGARGVGRHAQAKNVDATDVSAIKPRKGGRFAGLGAANEIAVSIHAQIGDFDSAGIRHQRLVKMPLREKRFTRTMNSDA